MLTVKHMSRLMIPCYLPLPWMSFLQVTSTLTFAAACASAGITVLIGNDLGVCSQNHCLEFETATAMAFLSWFCALPSFLLSFWSLASRWRMAFKEITQTTPTYLVISTTFCSVVKFCPEDQCPPPPRLPKKKKKMQLQLHCVNKDCFKQVNMEN